MSFVERISLSRRSTVFNVPMISVLLLLILQILCKIHIVLADNNKRSVYDDTGCIEDDDGIVQDRDWSEYWRLLFKKVTEEVGCCHTCMCR